MKGIASSFAVRRALPLLLTALLVPSAHAQNEIAPDQALQLQCGRGQLDALMHAVMSGLPRAEFGPVLAAPAYTAR